MARHWFGREKNSKMRLAIFIAVLAFVGIVFVMERTWRRDKRSAGGANAVHFRDRGKPAATMRLMPEMAPLTRPMERLTLQRSRSTRYNLAYSRERGRPAASTRPPLLAQDSQLLTQQLPATPAMHPLPLLCTS